MADEVESDLITDLRRQLENAQVEKQLAMAKMEQAAEHGLQGQTKIKILMKFFCFENI